MTDDELLETNWGRALVHESGHALIAVLQAIPCHGIFWNKTINKFCVLADVPADFNEYSQSHFLFSTAGSAAETVIYGDKDEDAAKSDKLPFETANAPAFERVLDEAHDIVSTNRRKLRRLVSLLKAKCKQVNLNLGLLNESVTNSSTPKMTNVIGTSRLNAASPM